MPDQETTTENVDPAVDTAVAEQVAPESKQDNAGDADLGDSGKAALAAEREARKQAEKRSRELERSIKEYEDRDKTELQKWQERAEAAEKRAADAEFTAMRSKIAAQKGVPASSLTGKTEDELIASADELIAWRDQVAKPVTPAKRPPTGGGLKSGATRTENINSDPKAAAAEALRRLRSSG